MLHGQILPLIFGKTAQKITKAKHFHRQPREKRDQRQINSRVFANLFRDGAENL
jgi:hypothetical protein